MDRTERSARVAEEAAEWMLRLTQEGMSRAARGDYVQWLQESPLHVAEILRITHVHKQLTEFPDWKGVPAADPSILTSQVVEISSSGSPYPSPSTPTSSFNAVISSAASANTESCNTVVSNDVVSNTVLSNIVVSHAYSRNSVFPSAGRPSNATPSRGSRSSRIAALVVGLATLAVTAAYFGIVRLDRISVPAGQHRLMTLPDGTVAQLGPQTSIEVRFSKHERDVLLSSGDVLFKVAKDPTKPFVVESGRARVRAVGTVFGVEHDGDAVVVTVQEGRVAVSNTETGSTAPRLENLPVTEISLGSDQQITVPPVGSVGGVRHVDSHRELAWADGRLIFDNESVAAVVRRFNQFNRVQLKVLDTTLANRPVSAVFDATDPEAFIIFLESVADVRVTRMSSTEVLIASEGPR